MVLRMPRVRASLGSATSQRRLRVADSARVVRGASADEIHVVMEGEHLDEPARSRRAWGLGEIPDGVWFGWASLPVATAGSLDVLVETAREGARTWPGTTCRRLAVL